MSMCRAQTVVADASELLTSFPSSDRTVFGDRSLIADSARAPIWALAETGLAAQFHADPKSGVRLSHLSFPGGLYRTVPAALWALRLRDLTGRVVEVRPTRPCLRRPQSPVRGQPWRLQWLGLRVDGWENTSVDVVQTWRLSPSGFDVRVHAMLASSEPGSRIESITPLRIHVSIDSESSVHYLNAELETEQPISAFADRRGGWSCDDLAFGSRALLGPGRECLVAHADLSTSSGLVIRDRRRGPDAVVLECEESLGADRGGPGDPVHTIRQSLNAWTTLPNSTPASEVATAIRERLLEQEGGDRLSSSRPWFWHQDGNARRLISCDGQDLDADSLPVQVIPSKPEIPQSVARQALWGSQWFLDSSSDPHTDRAVFSALSWLSGGVPRLEPDKLGTFEHGARRFLQVFPKFLVRCPVLRTTHPLPHRALRSTDPEDPRLLVAWMNPFPTQERVEWDVDSKGHESWNLTSPTPRFVRRFRDGEESERITLAPVQGSFHQELILGPEETVAVVLEPPLNGSTGLR